MSAIGSRLIIFFAIGFLLSLTVVAAVIVIIVIAVKKSRKNNPAYVPQEPVTPQQEEIRKTLGETLKELRTERNMTQEFVAKFL